MSSEGEAEPHCSTDDQLMTEVTTDSSSSHSQEVSSHDVHDEGELERPSKQRRVEEPELHADIAASAAASTAGGAVKRTFPCRVALCSGVFSSSSNRARHERMKHSTQTAGEPAPPAQITAPSTQPQGGSKRPRMSLLSYRHSGGQRTAAGPAAAVSQEPDQEVDEELARFLAGELEEEKSCSAQNSHSLSPQLASITEEDETSSAHVHTDHGSASSTGAAPLATAADSEGAASSTPSELGSDSEIPGMHLLLSDDDLQKGCMAFLEWLVAPPMTPTEVLVKQRRVKSLNHLQPIKNNLRFLFAALAAKELLPERKVDLRVLAQLSVCELLHDVLVERQVGSTRWHQLFLLVKKILVFLSSQESRERRQYLLPTMYESYMYVDGICHDFGHRRKQESRNRAVLGIEGSQQLLRAQVEEADGGGQARYVPQVFRVPTSWSGGAAKPVAPSQSQVAAAPSERKSPDEMTPTELQQLTKKCLDALHALMSEVQLQQHHSALQDRWFMALLVTATLCLGLAPRSQALAQLRIGSSFVLDEADRCFKVHLLADMCKNGRPTSLSLPSELTPIFEHYLQHVRPRLLQGAASSAGNAHVHSYVFVKNNGSAPRTDYSSLTTLVTQRYLGRSVNAHAFRSGVITTFYRAGASQADMHTLADLMGHDATTARQYYYRPQHDQAAVQTSQRMVHQLLSPSSAPAPTC